MLINLNFMLISMRHSFKNYSNSVVDTYTVRFPKNRTVKN
jgi:hypothetical protein